MLAASGLVLVNRALLRAGLRRRVDGWRRAAGLVLREEASTFVLSAFGLDAWSDVAGAARRGGPETEAHAARRLMEFLRAEPCCRVRVRRGEVEDRVEGCDGPSCTLAFRPWVRGPGRFAPPGDWSGEPGGAFTPGMGANPLMNIVCRVDEDGRADVWARVNHVGADGVPVQEMLSRLEAAWGGAESVRYPTHEAFVPHGAGRPLPGRPGLCEVQTFIDFERLLGWRKRANARLRDPMTVSAAVMWMLARHDAFAGIHIGTTVEVAAGGGLGRGVGVVVIRPGDYFGRRAGLARYASDFARGVERTRRRASDSCRTLDAVGLLPGALGAALLGHALERAPRAFGSMGLTMLKDARVFGAPLAAAGHGRGFMAVGSVGLASDGGGRVGCVSVKGPEAVVSGYPRALREALERGGD